ncbi:5-formyltetrahydrofolate cyclo-ligase [Leucothrix mucor]|uniref:5-formyltetrahydrofolate cyclo-ligase n=1 Tax=Leucothrix mucor TaxID=45248 RepID=UPI0003B3E2E1|nr:5-formyltetrahydrofolate cyclo-ligase [Leucothrix mucor]
MQENQQRIRHQVCAQRAALSVEDQTSFSAQICQNILDSGCLESAQHIAFYLPIRGEADPTTLQAQLAKNHPDRTFYVPILPEDKQAKLTFAAYKPDSAMIINRFGILEPDLSQTEILEDATKLDAVIMPLVAIDPLGNRIGMGGGYYDRTFAFKHQDNAPQLPQLIAFAYDFQMIETQTPQPWDVPAEAIATQSSFLRIKSAGY